VGPQAQGALSARAQGPFVVVVVGLLGAVGCEAPRCEQKQPLVEAEGWTFVEPADDPLWPTPPDAALCDADALQLQAFGDDVAVEIDTRFGCGWATVAQPIAEGLVAGDEVQLRVFHFAQATFPAAEAEVAVAIDDEILLQALVPIPTRAGLLSSRVSVAADHAAGSVARFHVGNHGDNSWNLVELARVVLGACDDEPAAP